MVWAHINSHLGLIPYNIQENLDAKKKNWFLSVFDPLQENALAFIMNDISDSVIHPETFLSGVI